MQRKQQSIAEIIVADSESDANLFYAAGFVVPDPVYFFRIRGKKYLMLSDLELDRGRHEAQVDEILSLSEWELITRKKLGTKASGPDIMANFLRSKGVSKAVLPKNFPAYFAQELLKRKISISFRDDPFWASRLVKTPQEKMAISLSLRHTGNAIRKAYEVLEKAEVKNGKIIYQGKPLGSERLKQVIDLYLMENECLAKNTIVAGGEQAVDPHNRGSGLLKPHSAIVMDVFPRSMKTQYYADMTRTVVKGKPSAELKKIWLAVKEAQERAIDKIQAGINGRRIHQGILDFFEKKGFKTGKITGRMQGFFHSTGHGLGLDIHEPPRISKVPVKLQEGMVVTVEPGLYYEGIGGVRIEDVVYVTRRGCELLSHCPKILSIE